MITKKLMHDIQTWLNSLYDFEHPNNIKNFYIITCLDNYYLKFVSIRVAIYSKYNGGLQRLIESYNKNITTYSDFETFKDEVSSTIEKHIEKAIKESVY